MLFQSRRRGTWASFSVGVVAAMFGVLLWQGLSAPPPAYGQVPDSGRQRLTMITELRRANKQLGEIVKLLKQIRDEKAPKADKRLP